MNNEDAHLRRQLLVDGRLVDADEWITQKVAAEPPLTESQKARIRALFAMTGGDDIA